uniref:Uncharacterized protein n=1 Tax=Fagus sylvatica TaxID=28930 RepID=A0A2N9FM85_FAGSY
MAEVMNMPVESMDRRRDRKEKSTEQPPQQSSTPPPAPPPPQLRRRERERERRADYYERNRSPPPIRDREYKRRSSMSPPPALPPPSYRDRRHSPPRRSPPPQYKRSRRDDEGRRGSPRGGPGDRRLGYDYGSGYEREMGGRPGYADERPHGRYMGRSSGGYQSGPSNDWDSGRGGYSDASNIGTTQSFGNLAFNIREPICNMCWDRSQELICYKGYLSRNIGLKRIVI